MLSLLLAEGHGGGLIPAPVRSAIDRLCDPQYFLPLFFVAFVAGLVFYRKWTQPKVAGGIALAALAGFGLALTNHNFLEIVERPDNIPIVGMLGLVAFFTWYSLRLAAVNDERIEKGEGPIEKTGSNDRVLVWPDLVFSEFIALILCTVLLVVWAIAVKAPLEDPANPFKTPNPSKAPWYFLGLQEMLVYYDPWLAGVVLPGLIIVGLCAAPYIDFNPKGNGYYTFKERRFAISAFLFGFLNLWVVMVLIGTFLRGPNWNVFGPFEKWDVHKVVVLNNVNLSEGFWIGWLKTGFPAWFGASPANGSLAQAGNVIARELPGLVLVLLYLAVPPPVLASTVMKGFYKRMGFIRFNLLVFLMLSMMCLPIKMILRWTLNLKYLVAMPEWFLNI